MLTSNQFKAVFDELLEKPIDQIDIATAPQQELELLYSKHQLMPTLKQAFIDANFPETLERDGIDVELGLTVLAQLALRKRCTVEVMVGLVKHKADSLQHAADQIYLMCDMDYADTEMLINSRDESHQQIITVNYEVSPEIQLKIDQYQYPLPMVVEPETVRNNTETGYQTIKGSLILKNNHHDDDICLDHINRSNQVALALDPDVVSFIQNQWKNLDKRKSGESHEDYEKRLRAFDKYDLASRDVIAGIMAHGDRFWLTHKYDKRGRTYCQGYHATYQGNDWNKASIVFADGEKLNKE